MSDSQKRATLDAWHARVGSELKGADFRETLVRQLREGIDVEPLYTERKAVPRLLRDREPRLTSFLSGGRSELAPAAAAAIAGGARHIWLSSSAARRSSGVLAGVLSALGEDATIELSTWSDSRGARENLVAARPRPGAAVLVLDPFGERGPLALARSTEALDVYQTPGVDTALVASAMPFHAAGADAADELSIVLSNVLEFQRWLLSSEPLRLVVRIGARQDVFVEIAKLRALRLCLAKLAVGLGHASSSPSVHVVTSPRIQSILDPWTNVLRGAAGAFAAICGGATHLTILPHDRRRGRTDLGDRLARNTFHLLVEEAGIAEINDPGGGSFYIEQLTDALARVAWSRMQDIERRGGLAEVLGDGWLSALLAERHAEQIERIATRQDTRVGVNAFATFAEADELFGNRTSLSDSGFDDTTFDSLRRRAALLKRDGRGPRVFLIHVHDPAVADARAAYATDVLASGGVSVVHSDGIFGGDRAALRSEFEASGCTAACLCGSDAAYRELAARVNDALPPSALRLIVGGDSMASFVRLADGGDITIPLSVILETCEAQAT